MAFSYPPPRYGTFETGYGTLRSVIPDFPVRDTGLRPRRYLTLPSATSATPPVHVGEFLQCHHNRRTRPDSPTCFHFTANYSKSTAKTLIYLAFAPCSQSAETTLMLFRIAFLKATLF